MVGPTRLELTSPQLDEQIESLDRVSGIYTLHSGGKTLHLSWSSNLGRRLKRLVSGSSTSLGQSIRQNADSIECRPTGSRLETNILLYRLAKEIYPDRYLPFLKLRLPWFVGTTARDPFPRLESSNRISPRSDQQCGPFNSRAAAQLYEQGVLSLFQIRRCTEQLTPHPEHPGCMYGEMNQCLRPCQAAVSETEYRSEAVRLKEFLATDGRGVLASLLSARERASEEMQFEQAAEIHKRIDRTKAVAGLRDPVIRKVDEFNGIALIRSVQKDRCLLWPMLKGLWIDPIELQFERQASRAGSLDVELRALLAAHVLSRPEQSSTSPSEELAIFSRWFYSSWRDGEWFPFTSLQDLSYRKLVRAVSKMAQEPWVKIL